MISFKSQRDVARFFSSFGAKAHSNSNVLEIYKFRVSYRVPDIYIQTENGDGTRAN